MKPILHAMICLLLASQVALAESNAAEEYERIMELWEALDENERDLLAELPPHLEPSPEALAVLRKQQTIDSLLLRAARKETCDFNLDFSQGPALLIPHLGSMRGVSRQVEARIRWHRMRGEHALAAKRLAALYQLGFHHGQDGLLISSLVGMASFSSCDESVAEGIEAGTIGPSEARLLLDTLKQANERDAFGITQSVKNEKTYFGGWVEKEMEKALQPDGSIEFSEDVKDMFVNFQMDDTGNWMEAFRSQDMAGYYRYMDDCIGAFSMEDHDAAQKKQHTIEAALGEGEYGTFALFLGPNLGRALEMMHKNDELLAERVELLEGIANGTIDPLEHANAAWWYIRAAKTARNLASGQQDDAGSREALLDTLFVATLIEHCEFPGFQDSYNPQPVVPPWSSGLRMCFQLLLDEARRQLESGNIDGCMVQLIASLEAAADLAANGSLVDSIIAQDATGKVLDLIERLEKEELLDAARRRKLLEALRSIPSSDPFGYMQAAEKTRILLVNHIGPRNNLSKHAKVFPSSPDDVLFTTAWCELAVERPFPYPYSWPLEVDWDALEGLVDGKAVLAARSQGVDAREAAKVDVMVELEPVANIATPSIEERRRTAATMLREWKRRLDR